MGNLKHAIAAIAAVSLVGSLAVNQAKDFSAVTATKIAQETEIKKEAPEVLMGDGEGETADFAVYTMAHQMMVGNDAYILTSGGNINMRAAADVESAILDVLEVGTKVKILDLDEDWFRIECGNNTGYVKTEFVTLDYKQAEDVLASTVMYRTGKAVQSINVRGTADENSIILAQVGEGGKVIILESIETGWYKVYFGDNYDIGYVSAEYISLGNLEKRTDVNAKRNARLAEVAKNAKIKTTAKAVEVKLIPSEESETIETLANNASCKVISGGTNWTKIVSPKNQIGYVRTSEVSVIAEAKTSKTTAAKKSQVAANGKSDVSFGTGNGAKLAAQAAKYIGTRYVYGGTTPSGFDCSGLVQYACRKLGVSVGRSASAQYSNGTAVSRSNLKAGDLVFFSRGGGISHVAIYAGGGQVIHAPRAGKRVCYQSLSSLSGSLRYVGARRVM